MSIQFIGQSSQAITLRETALRLSTLPVTVYLEGESGTGKSHFAELIHQNSTLPGKFIGINCASIPADLVESELFGYKKGAFTGANSDYAGKISQANHGTLFLDEISEMPLAMQAKLLDVLQSKSITPLGASVSEPVEFRLICASNQDIKTLVSEKKFRSDLFYRIYVYPIHLPALRERISDLESFILHFNQSQPDSPLQFSEQAFNQMLSYPWLGNIRELMNVLTRLSVCKKDIIDVQDLTFLSKEALSFPAEISENFDLRARMFDIEKRYIQQALQLSHGNVAQAARRLNLSRTTLNDKIKKYSLLTKTSI